MPPKTTSAIGCKVSIPASPAFGLRPRRSSSFYSGFVKARRGRAFGMLPFMASTALRASPVYERNLVVATICSATCKAFAGDFLDVFLAGAIDAAFEMGIV